MGWLNTRLCWQRFLPRISLTVVVTDLLTDMSLYWLQRTVNARRRRLFPHRWRCGPEQPHKHSQDADAKWEATTPAIEA